MKFCPECGVKLMSQKFCHECGCNISTYLNGASSSGFGSSNSFGNSNSSFSSPSNSNSSFSGGFDSFDFSAIQSSAQEQLDMQKKKESFYRQCEMKGTELVKYNGTDENVVIPEGVTVIKNSAFYNAKVKTITIPKTVTKIEEISLYSSKLEQICIDSENKNYKSIDGVAYSKDGRTLVQFPTGRGGHYSMPNEVEAVKQSAISGCVNLTGLTLSNRLTKINDFMFCGTGFSTLSIPSSVTSIGTNAFEMCGNLSSITVPGNVSMVGANAFSCCGNLRSVTLSEGVVSVGNSAFFNCTSLSSVTLPSSLNSLGAFAFQQCKSLTSITIPRGVSTIKQYTFLYCDNLSSVTLSEGVRVIESEAFNNYCLKSVKIPYSVHTISNSAFPSGGFSGSFKMYIPRGRSYGIETYGREFIEY